VVEWRLRNFCESILLAILSRIIRHIKYSYLSSSLRRNKPSVRISPPLHTPKTKESPSKNTMANPWKTALKVRLPSHRIPKPKPNPKPQNPRLTPINSQPSSPQPSTPTSSSPHYPPPIRAHPPKHPPLPPPRTIPALLLPPHPIAISFLHLHSRLLFSPLPHHPTPPILPRKRLPPRSLECWYLCRINSIC